MGMQQQKKQPKRPPRSAKAVARRLCGVVCLLLLIWSLLPLINGIVHIGVVLPAVCSGLGALWGFGVLGTNSGKRKGWRRWMTAVLLGLVCAVAALGIVLSACMVGAAINRPAREDATVIVLGAMVRGDQPSRMLRDRLNAAAAYLDKHPAAVCIVSGGQGADEDYSEAYVMRKYLVEQKGIDPARIRLEERSTSTYENIRYSMEIIRQEGLCDGVAIATQEFHQYRASTMARQAGASAVGAITCHSPLHLLLCYWVRECAAICRLWILGY